MTHIGLLTLVITITELYYLRQACLGLFTRNLRCKLSVLLMYEGKLYNIYNHIIIIIFQLVQAAAFLQSTIIRIHENDTTKVFHYRTTSAQADLAIQNLSTWSIQNLDKIGLKSLAGVVTCFNLYYNPSLSLLLPPVFADPFYLLVLGLQLKSLYLPSIFILSTKKYTSFCHQ